jgi:hypothetical protein
MDERRSKARIFGQLFGQSDGQEVVYRGNGKRAPDAVKVMKKNSISQT